MKVFSFCLWGDKPKYKRGMHENIRDITAKFPDWIVFIYYSNAEDVDDFTKYANVRCIKGEYTENQLMLDRFKPIDDPDVEIMFVRDSDSRINARDEWCIQEFIKSNKLFHIIRDHPYHVSLVMGGLWGIKRGCISPYLKISNMIRVYANSHPNLKGFDQFFLNEHIYPRVITSALLHGSLKMRFNEELIGIPVHTPHQFCGQPIEYDDNGNEYHNCEDCKVMNNT